MNGSVALKLGRVSNLPTVWTNSLAALLLAGGNPVDAKTLPLLLSMSLFYSGGMYLNDAFDAGIDSRERPERPIPSGQINLGTVFALGFGMIIAGLLLLLWIGFGFDNVNGMWPFLGGLGLAAAIIFYNYHHKENPLSPVVMGLCRLMVYITAALCFVLPLPGIVWMGGALLVCYLIGLTYIAKQENLNQVENMWPLLFLAAPVIAGAILSLDQFPVASILWFVFSGWILAALYFLKRRQAGDIPRAVVSLIAGMSLFDALLIAAVTGQMMWALLAVAGFGLTLFLQRFVSGT